MSCKNVSTYRLQTLELLARIVGWNNVPIVSTDIVTMTYSAFILRQATGEEIPVSSHQNIALTPILDYISDPVVNDDKWNEDEIGYNFHFVPPSAIFTESGELYLIRVTMDPVDVDQENLYAVFFIEVE